jgi:hypothetical protein
MLGFNPTWDKHRNYIGNSAADYLRGFVRPVAISRLTALHATSKTSPRLRDEEAIG